MSQLEINTGTLPNLWWSYFPITPIALSQKCISYTWPTKHQSLELLHALDPGMPPWWLGGWQWAVIDTKDVSSVQKLMTLLDHRKPQIHNFTCGLHPCKNGGGGVAKSNSPNSRAMCTIDKQIVLHIQKDDSILRNFPIFSPHSLLANVLTQPILLVGLPSLSLQ